MSKSTTEPHHSSDIFVCERCKHRFVGYVANGNQKYCKDCRKEKTLELQRMRNNSVAFDEHVSHATAIIDEFLQGRCGTNPFVKISDIVFWVKEHPETMPYYWTSEKVLRRWITQTLKTKYPYKHFSTGVYIRDD